eukprot:scaffold97066_cov16-Tisochrysis_lutea.AAC.1
MALMRLMGAPMISQVFVENFKTSMDKTPENHLKSQGPPRPGAKPRACVRGRGGSLAPKQLIRWWSVQAGFCKQDCVEQAS